MNPVINKIIAKLRKHPQIEKIILFGSRARGDAEDRADIDLAVVCPQLSEKEWVYLWHEIDEIETLLSIDLIRFDTASEKFQKIILKEGRILYERH